MAAGQPEINQDNLAAGTTSVPAAAAPHLSGATAEEPSAAPQPCRCNDANLHSASAPCVSLTANAVADIIDATTDSSTVGKSVVNALEINSFGQPTAHTVAKSTTGINSSILSATADPTTENVDSGVTHISTDIDAAPTPPGNHPSPSSRNVTDDVSNNRAASCPELADRADCDCLHDDVVASSRGTRVVLEDLTETFTFSDDDAVIVTNLTALTETINKFISDKEQAEEARPAQEDLVATSISDAVEVTIEKKEEVTIDTKDITSASTSNENDDLNEGIVYHGGARRRDPKNYETRNNAGCGSDLHPNRKKRNGFTNIKNVAVPSDQMSRIMGRGGSRFHEFEYDSEIRVQVGNAEGPYTDFAISGTNDAMSSAETSRKSVFTESYKKNPEDVCVIEWNNLKSYYEKLQEDLFGELPPIVKDFYQEDPEVEHANPSDTALWRKNNGVKVQRMFRDKPELRPIPNPALTFENIFKHYPEILTRVRNEGYQAPSHIQSQAWPVLMRGEDMIGITQPGPGKTLIYLLPALIHIDGQNFVIDKRRRPIVLIIVPTNELAFEVEIELMKYQSKGLKFVSLTSGGSRRDQIKIVCKGVDLIIATPCRLNDILLAGHLSMDTFSYIVLDEVDKMLEIGFEHQLRKALHNTRPDKQIVLISSVYSKVVRNLAQSYQKDPIKIQIKTSSVAAVTQRIMILEEAEKERAALQFLRRMGPSDRVIMFCKNKETATHITSKLGLKGIGCISLVEPPKDLENPVNVFIGIHGASYDMSNMSHIINYDFPADIEEYVHETSQLPADGGATALTFVTRHDWCQARALTRVLAEAHQDVPEELDQMARRFEAMRLRDVVRGRGHFMRDQRGRL